jgi:small neutral amino acid transporter SnatA (MarC family)
MRSKAAVVMLIAGVAVLAYSIFSFSPSHPVLAGNLEYGTIGFGYDILARLGIALGAASVAGGILLFRRSS